MKLNMIKSAAICVLAIGAASCGKSSSYLPPANAARVTPAEVEKVRQAEAQAKLSSLPRADAAVPESAYADMKGATQLVSLYYALSGMPLDYEKLAPILSEEYAMANDEFRKRDLMAALKPRIDAQVQELKDPRSHYFRMTTDHSGLQHYNFETKSFPVNLANLAPDHYIYFNSRGPSQNYTLDFTNGGDYQALRVLDEQRAKELESLTSRQLTYGTAEVYFFAQAADPSQTRVHAQVVKVKLVGQNHQPLGDI